MPFHEKPLDLGFSGTLEAGLEDHVGSANECDVYTYDMSLLLQQPYQFSSGSEKHHVTLD